MTDKQKQAIKILNKARLTEINEEEYMFLLEIVIDCFCTSHIKDDMLDLERRLLTYVDNKATEITIRLNNLEYKITAPLPFEPNKVWYDTNGEHTNGVEKGIYPTVEDNQFVSTTEDLGNLIAE